MHNKPTFCFPTRARALLCTVAIFLCASVVLAQPAPALATPSTLAPIAFTRAPCLPPSPSFCATGYVTAAGSFTPTDFSVEAGSLVLNGTFAGSVEYFGSTFTLTNQPASLPVDAVTLSPHVVVIKTALTLRGPYMENGPVGNVTVVSMAFVDPSRPGLGFQSAEVQWISTTTRLHHALGLLGAWFWKQSAGDPELEAEVLNWLLF